jgi:dihydrofolate reductase
MSRVRVHNMTISLDGFGTGEPQTLDAPFGHGHHIMRWFMGTRSFNEMLGKPGEGETGIDDTFAKAWGSGIGVEIMGRRKFWPYPGPWRDDAWKGWWGDDPPFHTPCIVLTHHPRETLQMKGGTTFHFVDASPSDALARARALAPGKDVRIGGGPTTVREFLEAGLVDYMHVAVAPVLLGRGERLWGPGLEGLEKKFDVVRATSSPSGVTHIEFERAGSPNAAEVVPSPGL